MSGLYAKYQTDSDAEVNGRWKTMGFRELLDPEKPGKMKKIKIRWRIASTDPLGNPVFVRETEKALRGMRKVEEADQEELEAAQLDVVSRVIIVGWENQDGPDGKDLPYSPENVRLICGDRSMRKVYQEALEFAGNFQNYLKALPEADAKN